MLRRPPADEGATRPTLPIEARSAAHATFPRWRFVVLEGNVEKAVFLSRSERTQIGTKPANDLVLTDPTVSRYHCEVQVSEGRALVRDLDSRNGTRINGVLVREAFLEAGDTLTLGRVRLRVEASDDAIRIPLSNQDGFGLLKGRSQAMRLLFAELERISGSTSTVLVEGETGTGKELLAHSLHQESPRRDNPFVVVDCGAIAPGLVESHLFGHLQGAFTGATSDRVGAFVAASGGTLFLDEVGELDLAVQPKLLRALEVGEVTPVGGSATQRVDVRVIAATHRSLQRMVNAQRFRSDLYYRLAVLTLRMPPLRERLEDLPLLIDSLLEQARAAGHPVVPRLKEPTQLAELARHDWPGNVRELRNYVERCLALDELQAVDPATAPAQLPGVNPAEPYRQARERFLATFEREYFLALLRSHGGNVSAAARAAGIDRVYLHRLLSRHKLKSQR